MGAGLGAPGQLDKSSRYWEWEADFSSRRPMLAGRKGEFDRLKGRCEGCGRWEDLRMGGWEDGMMEGLEDGRDERAGGIEGWKDERMDGGLENSLPRWITLFLMRSSPW